MSYLEGLITLKKNYGLSEQKGISQTKNYREVPIVGIGASAGGLEAITSLLEHLEANTGLVFVIVQHLATGQESMLPSILARSTKMPVFTVKDEMPVEPNCVYVIPPGKTLTYSRGHLKLIPRGASIKPIDAFFCSIAEQLKTQAMGIVLSGTGTDGTEGLKEIKNEGGITFAQDPKTSQYSGMPQSAISSEAVDFILSPEQIGQEVSKIANNPQLARAEIDALEAKSETRLGPFFSLLKSNFKVDFSQYKDSFLNRRIKRRMVLTHIDDAKSYAAYLKSHPVELQNLFDDLLVGVTNFFREPRTFALLKEKVFPEACQEQVIPATHPNMDHRLFIR